MTTEERSSTQEASQANGFNSNAKNDDKGVQDSENQDNAIEDDCIIGLDATDVWDDDEKDKPRRRSWDRARGEKKRTSREREKERDRDYYRSRRRSRSRGRRSRSRGRRSRSNDKKREQSRRDPSKSNKDIEQDKLRAKKDNDSKILAEKEKAIKTLLDSDNVLPPGTETEAIQTIVEKNQQEQEIRNQEDRNRVSRDTNKKRSPIHNRLGPKKLSKSPIRLSPIRRSRRSPSSPIRRRRSSADRENSTERRIASRRRLRERGLRRSRSRSRDRRRSRSRSYERRRSRSGGRRSRSPFDRRLRRRTMSRSRSPDRSRRRSPFINELARQFSHEGNVPVKPPMVPGPPMPGYGGPPPPIDPRMAQPALLPTPGMPGPSMMNPMHPGHPAPQPQIMHPGPRGPPFLGYDGQPRPFEPPMNMGPAPVVDFPGPAPVDFPAPGMFNPALMNPVAPQPVPQPVPAPVIGQIGYPAGLGAPLQHPPPNAVGSREIYSPNASYNSRRSGSPGNKASRSKSKREERMKTPEPPKPPIISDVKPTEKTSLSSLLEASVSNKDASSATASAKGFRPEILKHCERALRSLPTEDPRLKMKGRFFFEPLKKDEKKDKLPTGSNSILLRKGRTEILWEEEDQKANANQPAAPQPTISRVVTHQKYCQTEEKVLESIAVQAEETPKQTSDFSQQVAPVDLMPPAEETRRGPPAMMMEDSRRMPPMEDSRRMPPMEDSRRMPPMEDIRRPIEDIRRPIEDIRRPIEDMRRPIEDIRRPIEDMRRPIEDNRRTAIEETTRRGAMEDARRPTDRLDWSMRETYDHGADRIRDTEDLRWSLSNSGAAGGGGGIGGIAATANAARMGERSAWSRGFSPKPIDHMHGNAAVNMNDYMRQDNRDMDMRDRDMDVRMDMRVLEMLRERERLMGDVRGTAGLANRPAGLEDFTTRRQPVNDEFDMRKNYGGGSSSGGGPGSIGSFNRAMEMMEKERDEPQFGDSPIPDDPDDDLEIIEERAPTWPPRPTAATTAPSFGNARGGGGAGVGNVNRSFRGRLGGYRNY